MAHFSRLDVLNALIDTGLVPLFYQHDAAVAKKIAEAVADGGARLLEFTNRGDFAQLVFTDLSQYLAKTNPQIILGAGSIVDAPTAAIYIASGANFIVGPNLNPEVARFCNRRKIAYIPGCGTASEIAQAEELGAEIVKIFPGDSLGGPDFVKAILGPSPWTRLMPTGGVETTKESIMAWFKAGITAAGIGSNLIKKDLIATENYAAITAKTAEVLAWIREVRRDLKK
jgi:2-dehydro-3-deoxyphosphogluconate aldolase/(4S)-4-hydroxy-2-oxoglutarate aldolase